MLSIWFRGHFK